MNQRLLIYGGAALLAAALLLVRYGCRGGLNAPPGDTLEARLAQIDAMRQRRNNGDVARLAELVQHPQAAVKRAAIYALADFSSPAAAEALRRLVHEGAESEMRAAAADALGQSGREIGLLMDVLRNDSDPLVRAGAARGLVSWSDPDRREALPAFLAALEDDDAQVRKVAVRGVYQVSLKRFLYEPDKPPQPQKERIAFIQQRMKELKLLD